MRKIEILIVIFCAIAAILCVNGSNFASLFFIFSSSLGLFDSIKNKAKSGVMINTIFLTMNAYNSLYMIATFLF